MSRVAELITRINARTGATQPVTPGTGGGGISWEDIAYGLAGIEDPLLKNMILLKYAGKNHLLNGVQIELEHRAEIMSREHGWLKRKIKGDSSKVFTDHRSMLRRIAKLALDEYLAPAVCPTCKGEIEVIINGQVVQCSHCTGNGLGHWGIHRRALAAGIHSRTWRNKGWDRRYKDFWMWIVVSEAEALHDIEKRIFSH